MNEPHPATGDRIYTEAETEFLLAMERYRRENGRKFPTSSEVLAVLVSLGYRRVAEPTELPRSTEPRDKQPIGFRRRVPLRPVRLPDLPTE